MPYRDVDLRHQSMWAEADWAVVLYTDASIPVSVRESLEHELGPDHDLMITPIYNEPGQEIVIWSDSPINVAIEFALEALEDAILTFCLLYPNQDPGFKITNALVMPLDDWRRKPVSPEQ